MSRATAQPLPAPVRRATPAIAALAASVAVMTGPVAHAAEPDVVSYTTGIATEVHDATTGAVLTPGDIEVGDRIDYEIQVTNTGTVWLNGLEICTVPGFPISGMTSTLLQLGPGKDLSDSSLYPMQYRSAEEFSHWPEHTITGEDLARGWVQLEPIYVHVSRSRSQYDPMCADTDSPDAPGEWVFAAPVVLRDLATDLSVTVDMTLRDNYPDGLGQEWEQIDITWTATNPSESEQSITIDGATASGNAPGPGTAFDGVTLAPGESVDRSSTFAIGAAREASGSIAAGVSFAYSGDIDGLARSTATVQADPIATVAVPDNRLELELDVTYADTNSDGHPSIGEEATAAVKVTNTGLNTQTDVMLSDGGGSDVTGLRSGSPEDVPVRGVLTWQFTHVITAQDFARGSILFATEVASNELWGNPVETSASLTPITFAAYEDDLEPGAEGGIAVCSPGGEPVLEASPGDSIVVTPDDCAYAGASEGYRVVMASTPVVLATGAFSAAIPGDAEPGAHRIGLYGPDGALIGWQALDVVPASEPEPEPEADSAGGELPSTGFESWALVGAAAAMAALGAAAVLARRRFA